MTSQGEFLACHECIAASFQTAMKEIEKAIEHEEHEHPLDAIEAYECSLALIEHIFQIPVGLPDDLQEVATQWNDACIKIQKLKNAKAEILHRLKVLNAAQAQLLDVDTEEATESSALSESPAKHNSLLIENPHTFYDIHSGAGTTKTYREIINGLRSVIATKECDVCFDTIFQAAAKLYKVQTDGHVATMGGETTMSLVLCTVGGQWSFLSGIYFIQCAFPENILASTSSRQPNNDMIWIYPLIPSLTICYRTEFGAFIFPDLESQEPGAVFGIMITDPNTPLAEALEDKKLSDQEQFFLDLLEAVLCTELGTLKEPQTARPQRDTSHVVSKNIVSAADFIARNLVRGAEKTGDLMIKTTPYIISKMNPAADDAPPMPAAVQTSVEVAKSVSSTAAEVTGWVAGKVGSASMALGRFLAPHIQTQGSNLLQKGFGFDSNEANSKMEGALTIAAGAVEGFSSVFNGLETSAKILGTSLSNNSVRIIEYKYGPSAGTVASGTFDTIGNAFNVSQNVNYITPKGFAKKMAKNTGKAVVLDYKRNLREDGQYVPAGDLYPDLNSLKASHFQ